MKILIVSETLLDGGAELFALRLTRGLKNAGLNVELLNLNKRYERQELTTLFKDVTIHRLDIPFQTIIEKFDYFLLKLRIDFSIKYYLQGRLLKKKFLNHYDVIHTNYIQVDYLFSNLKSQTRNFKHVVTVHGDYSAQYNDFAKNKKLVWLSLDKKLENLKKKVDRWVVISDEQLKFFRDFFCVNPKTLFKIYTGYIPNKQITSTPYKLADPVFTIGMVSRGVKEKGWKLLIEAFLKLPSDCRLILVGDGPYLDDLKKEFESKSNIIFWGFHPNPVEVIAAFDVFVLPTLFPYESLPTVITEALFCSKAVIATKVGEIEKMITDQSTGKKAGFLLNPIGDKINTDDLFNSLVRLYTNRDELIEMQETANRAFKKFNMDTFISEYSKLYEEVIKNPS